VELSFRIKFSLSRKFSGYELPAISKWQNVSKHIMTKLHKTTFVLLLIFFASCEKKISNLEFEKNVMTEIFPNLIDSTCIDIRLMTNFPPKYGESIYDKTGHYIGIDSTKATTSEKLKLLEWKKRTLEIKNDTTKLIIAFDPKIKNSRDSLKNDFEKHFPKAKIFKPKAENETEYILDFQNIKLNNKFELKNISEFPKERGAIWETKYNFLFSGVVYFSRIQFDEQKTFGILDAGFYCGRLCGQGFRIYIKKVNNKWIIDEIERTWIS
jgi:hypothetical protein